MAPERGRLWRLVELICIFLASADAFKLVQPIPEHLALPKALKRVAVPGVVDLSLFYVPSMQIYATEIFVGSPMQQLFCSVSTSSSDLLVWAGSNETVNCENLYRNSYSRTNVGIQYFYNCSYSSNITGQWLGNVSNLQISYSSRSTAWGAWANDTLYIGDWNASLFRATVGVLGNGSSTCVLGLGPVNGELTGTAMENGVVSPVYDNTLVLLKRGGFIHTLSYSLWFSKTSTTGFAQLGGLDQNLYQGNLTRVPIVGYFVSDKLIGSIGQQSNPLEIRIMLHGIGIHSFYPSCTQLTTATSVTAAAVATGTGSVGNSLHHNSTITDLDTKNKLKIAEKISASATVAAVPATSNSNVKGDEATVVLVTSNLDSVTTNGNNAASRTGLSLLERRHHAETISLKTTAVPMTWGDTYLQVRDEEESSDPLENSSDALTVIDLSSDADFVDSFSTGSSSTKSFDLLVSSASSDYFPARTNVSVSVRPISGTLRTMDAGPTTPGQNNTGNSCEFSANYFLSVPVLLDTTELFSYLPSSIVNSFAARFGMTMYNGHWASKCDLNSTIYFNFSGAILSVSMSAMLLDSRSVLQRNLSFSDGSPVCLFALVPQSGANYVLGTSLLTLLYTVFDLENNELALAYTNSTADTAVIAGVAPITSTIPNASFAALYSSTSVVNSLYYWTVGPLPTPATSSVNLAAHAYRPLLWRIVSTGLALCMTLFI